MSTEQQDETQGFVVEDAQTQAMGAEQTNEDQAKPEGDEADGEGGDTGAEKKGDKEELPEWTRKRIARANRKRDEAYRERDEFAEKYETASKMIDQLRRQKNGGLDPNDFETVKDYMAAKKTMEDGERKLTAPPAMSEDLREALDDVREACDAVDDDLWRKLGEIPADEAFLADKMILSLADLEDDAPKALAAWLTLGPEEREEIADMTSRKRKRALSELAAKPPKKAAAKAADADAEDASAQPPRGADGQFVKRQSSAPDPMNPVRGSATGEVPLEKASFSDFEARRNAEEKGRAGSRW